MNRWVRRLFALCGGFALTLSAYVAADNNKGAADVKPGVLLGTVDFDSYCVRTYGDSASAVHRRPGAFGWECWAKENKLVTTHTISVDDVCRLQYAVPSYAVTYDQGSPFSWQCYTGARSQQDATGES
ncbi:MAG: hypothetical protein H6513_09535 [Acidimicrobiaceae bacterium]|nr:hypothetical protein [Acidimicrobiaceae bacterium]